MVYFVQVTFIKKRHVYFMTINNNFVIKINVNQNYNVVFTGPF